MKHLIYLSLLLLSLSTNAQSIYEIQGQTEASPYDGQTVSTKGIVTAVFSSGYFIQDGDSVWTGLYVFDEVNTPSIGDSLALTGDIEEYYDLTELKNVSDYSVVSTGNPAPKPIVVPTGDATEQWEGVLIKVEGATCTNTDLGYGEWEVNDGSGAIAIDDMGVVYTPIKDVEYIISGPLNYSFSAFKIEPRNDDDIMIDLPVYFTKVPVANEIMTTSLSFELETNVESSISMQYGLTTDFEIGTVYSSVSSTTHSIKLSTLQAATVYYTKTIGTNVDAETTPIHNGVFITQSESSGEIKTYFNHEEFAMPTKDLTTDIIATTISYIEKAETSLDITMYDLTNHAPTADSSNYELIQVVNKAHERGVQVRFITDDEPSNTALDSLNPEIQVLPGNFDGIMHNKFLIIDAESADNSWVITGSLNWTYNNLMMDFNNMICIQDQSLAKAYEIEFNEMWGLAGPIPHLEDGRFGAYKTDNTPHQFNINGTYTELYFSPSDKTTSKIVNAIDNAQTYVDFAIMAFTENQLGTALVNANKRGVKTQGFIDYVDFSGSEYDYLVENGVDALDFKNPDESEWPEGKTLHHKFSIIDPFDDNPVLITGTHNWTAAAESKNDENTLFIYSAEVAQQYTEEMQQIFNYMNANSINDALVQSQFQIFPNPSNGNIKVTSLGDEKIELITIYSITGLKIFSTTDANDLTIDNSGLYFVEIINNSYREIQKVIIE